MPRVHWSSSGSWRPSALWRHFMLPFPLFWQLPVWLMMFWVWSSCEVLQDRSWVLYSGLRGSYMRKSILLMKPWLGGWGEHGKHYVLGNCRYISSILGSVQLLGVTVSRQRPLVVGPGAVLTVHCLGCLSLAGLKAWELSGWNFRDR
jgi:hypothetical protein